MVPVFIAVAAGVYVGAKIISAIYDELSDKERTEQEKLHNLHEQVKKAYQTENERLRRTRAQGLFEIKDEARAAERGEFKRFNESFCEEMSSLRAAYLAAVQERLNDKESLDKELYKEIGKLRNILKEHATLLRKNALNTLLFELHETKNRNSAYILYLKRYMKILNYQEKCKPHVYPPEMAWRAPEELFYRGKVIYILKKDLKPEGNFPLDLGNNLAMDQYYIFDESEFIEDASPDMLIPLMIDGNLEDRRWVSRLSAKKGFMKDILANAPRGGLDAQVCGFDRREQQYILKYGGDIKLVLPNKFLENEKHWPPHGATLRVYPFEWDYMLHYPVKVSEKSSDSYLGCVFDDIPVVFSEDGWSEFCEVLEKNNLMELYGDWKIAPMSEADLPNVYALKFQIDAKLCFSTTIHSEKGKLWLEYDKLLGEEDLIHSDDIFYAVDCSLNATFPDDRAAWDEQVYENMSALYFRTMQEFKVQLRIKASREGMPYFNKWSDAIERLIKHLYKGKKITLQVRYVVPADSNYLIVIGEKEKLKNFIDESFMESKSPQFFCELPNGDYHFLQPSPDGSSFVFPSGGDYCGYLDGLDEITVYRKNIPTPERKQANALEALRNGKLVNPLLQPYILDASKIVSSPTREIAGIIFRNQAITEDLSQVEATKKALAEEHIFFIQGPPGTGKTTVICEIIEQELQRAPSSKILVVSQANVAVDNILRKFINGQISIIRCGSRIDNEVKSYSFDANLSEYKEKIRKKIDAYPADELLSRWNEMVLELEGVNPILGELIIREKSLVGVTCVGLAARGLGLERQEFDLVIIDEAGKALPGELLIPYTKARKVILIGDHRQLPPTVHPALISENHISDEEKEDREEELFDISLFQRMYEKCPPSNKAMLKIQYRMPAILGTMISEVFYDGSIENGKVTELKEPLLVFNKDATRSSIVFVDHKYEEFAPKEKSPTNKGEIVIILFLLSEIFKKDPKANVGIITPYKGQKALILEKLQSVGDIKRQVDVDTIDAFQGDEKKVIIYCTTRTRRKTAFFSDPRRINVAMSRAQNQLFIVGSLNYFDSYGTDSPLGKVANYMRMHGHIANIPINKIERMLKREEKKAGNPWLLENCPPPSRKEF